MRCTSYPRGSRQNGLARLPANVREQIAVFRGGEHAAIARGLVPVEAPGRGRRTDVVQALAIADVEAGIAQLRIELGRGVLELVVGVDERGLLEPRHPRVRCVEREDAARLEYSPDFAQHHVGLVFR